MAGQDPVVQRLKGNWLAFQLALHVLVAVDAQLRVEREVRAELQEERAEVTIDGVEIVLIHHRRRAEEPSVRGSRLRVPPALRPEDRCFLLSLTHEEQALRLAKAGAILCRHFVLTL